MNENLRLIGGLAWTRFDGLLALRNSLWREICDVQNSRFANSAAWRDEREGLCVLQAELDNYCDTVFFPQI